MPSLVFIALRYLAWLIALRILYVTFTMLTSLPNPPATLVILTAAPAVEIAMYAMRNARDQIALGGWVKIWAVIFAVYAVVDLGLPTLLFAQTRLAIMDGSGLSSIATVLLSTGVMQALFLWIGTRAGKNGGGNS